MMPLQNSVRWQLVLLKKRYKLLACLGSLPFTATSEVVVVVSHGYRDQLMTGLYQKSSFGGLNSLPIGVIHTKKRSGLPELTLSVFEGKIRNN